VSVVDNEKWRGGFVVFRYCLSGMDGIRMGTKVFLIWKILICDSNPF